MTIEKFKLILGMMVFFYSIIGLDCLFMEPDPQPIRPQPMVMEKVIKEDAQGNALDDPENPNRFLYEEKLVPKKFDAKTDSIWDGVRLRNVVYLGMGVIMFLSTGAWGYLAFTGSVYWLSSIHLLPQDVPATADCIWQMFFGPIILIMYCVYASYQTIKKG